MFLLWHCPWTNLSWQDKPWAKFSTLEVAASHAMHFVCSIAIRTNLELKTRPKQLLGPLLLDIALPALSGLYYQQFKKMEVERFVKFLNLPNAIDLKLLSAFFNWSEFIKLTFCQFFLAGFPSQRVLYMDLYVWLDGAWPANICIRERVWQTHFWQQWVSQIQNLMFSLAQQTPHQLDVYFLKLIQTDIYLYWTRMTMVFY